MFLLLFCGGNTVNAQEFKDSVKVLKNDSTDLKNIAIEDLVNIKVLVSSKRNEKITETPGSVVVYTNEDMNQLGYYTLSDLANITSGYSAFSGIGEKTFETRGQKSFGFDNNKHLVLINGIPFSHTRANKANAEEDLPLLFANRVEFLKGPGSALYGISAYYGVINILGKNLDSNGFALQSKLSVGTYDFKKRFMANAVMRNISGQTQIALSYFGKDATREFLGDGSVLDTNSLYYDNVTSLFLYANHQLTKGTFKDLSIGFIYSKKIGGLGDFWMDQQNQTYQYNQLEWEQIVPYLKYERKWGDKWSMNAYYKANVSSEKGYTGGYQNTTGNGNAASVVNVYNVRVYNHEFFLEGRYNPTKFLFLNAGLNYDSRYNPGKPESYSIGISQLPGLNYIQDPSYFNRTSDFITYSAFAQGQLKANILKGMVLTGGLRFDYGIVNNPSAGVVENNYTQFSPRLILVQNLTKNISTKAIYSTALRSPIIKEVGVNVETKNKYLADTITSNDTYIDSIPNALKAESIQSFEGSFMFHNKYTIISLVGFYNYSRNQISKMKTGVNDDIYFNSNGYTEAFGAEVDVKMIPIQYLIIGLNFSYAEAWNNPNDKVRIFNRVTNVPDYKLNGYLTFQMKTPFVLNGTIVNRWIHGYWSGVNNSDLMPGHFVMDFNMNVGITKNLILEFQIRNLLNSTYRTPAFFDSGKLNVPGAGRSFLFSLNVNF